MPLPDEWNLIQVAKYLGVPPWELINQPRYWLSWGAICMSAENELQQKQQEKQGQKQQRKGNRK